MTTKLRDAALEYVRRGWKVFPVAELEKQPRISVKDGGKGVHDATTNEDQILSWWNRFPNANIGIHCDGFWVLDVDEKSGGPESIADLETKHAPLPETLRQLTPGSGKHYLFKMPTGVPIKNRAGFCPGLDTRAGGGYIVASPSETETGAYRWENEGTAIAEAPAWLLALVSDACRLDTACSPAMVLASAIREGEGRNDAMHRLTCSLMRTLNGNEAAVKRAVIEQNSTVCKPPLSEAELDQTIESAFRFFRSGKADIHGQYKRAVVAQQKAQLIDARSRMPQRPEVAPNWIELTTKKRDMTPSPTLGTAILMLERSPEFAASLAHNEFSGEVTWMRDLEELGIRRGTRLDDSHALEIVNYGEMKFGIVFERRIVDQAISTVSRRSSSHPVRNYLQGLPKPLERASVLDTWLSKYLGVTDNPLTQAMGSKFLISAVARIMEPGCQVDYMLVFEGGEQGEGKSSAIRSLFSDEWAGSGLKKLNDRDELMKLRGKWAFEMGEMAHIGKNERSVIKAFLTERTDRMRLPYGRSAEDFKRQCVFIGTTNDSEYLDDDVNRRYWPVKVGRSIDCAGLKRDRDLIWAEAYHRYLAGERWWFDSTEEAELIAQMKEEQVDRRMDDPWQGAINRYLGGCRETSMEAIYSLLGICLGNMKGPESKRIAHCLKVARWSRVRLNNGGLRSWVYRPTVQARFSVSEVPQVLPTPVKGVNLASC